MSQASEGRNILERITFFTGLLVLVGLCGYLTYQLTQNSSGPPELKIISTYEPKANEYTFEVQVENMGQTTAEGQRYSWNLIRMENRWKKLHSLSDIFPRNPRRADGRYSTGIEKPGIPWWSLELLLSNHSCC